MSSNAKVQYGPRSITFYDVSGFAPVQGAGSMILGQGDARQLDIGRYTTNSTDSNLFIRIDTSFNRMIVGNNFTDLQDYYQELDISADFYVPRKAYIRDLLVENLTVSGDFGTGVLYAPEGISVSGFAHFTLDASNPNLLVENSSGEQLMLITGDASSGGLVTFGVPVQMSSNLDVDGIFYVSNVGYFGSNLNVSGEALFGSNVTIDQDLDIGSNLVVSNNFAVGGVATFSNTLSVQNTATFSNVVNVGGIATFSNDVNVDGTATFNSNAIFIEDVSMNANLVVGSNLEVGGIVTLSSELYVVSNAVFSNTVDIAGATYLSNTLTVDGVATFNSNVIFGQDLSLNENLFVGGTLEVGGFATLSNELLVVGATTLSSELLVGGAVNMSNTLTVEGLAQFISNVNVFGTTFLEGLTANQTAIFQSNVDINDNLYVQSNVEVGCNLTVGGTSGFAGAVVMSNTLQVSNLATFSNNVNVEGALGVVGASTFSNSLDVNGAATFSNTLNVNGAATFSNTVTITGNLNVVGTTTTINSTTVTISDNILVLNYNPEVGIADAGFIFRNVASPEAANFDSSNTAFWYDWQQKRFIFAFLTDLSADEADTVIPNEIELPTDVGNSLMYTNIKCGEIECNQINVISDKRLKTNVRPLGTTLHKIKKMRGVRYKWKRKQNIDEVEPMEDIGFLAQEVEEVFPEMVTERNGIKTVSYQKMVVILLEAVKEQQRQIDDLTLRLMGGGGAASSGTPAGAITNVRRLLGNNSGY